MKTKKFTILHSKIDAEWKGCSTIEIMNYLAPDVVAIGNHEVDYGLPHLLFLEKMANFPLVNANLYVIKNNRRFLLPYLILKYDYWRSFSYSLRPIG